MTSTTINFPVKSYVQMASPSDSGVIKHRFYANVNDIPDELLAWMRPNPREQNLSSPVAKTIASSLSAEHQEFHLKNRGILMSALDVACVDNWVSIILDDPLLHGNIDGGHTLRLILAAPKPLVGKYVEFEILTGLRDVVEVAEARNTSAALDLRSLAEAKNAYQILKDILCGKQIGGAPVWERIEYRQNQMSGITNPIDIRTIISILLMFNQKIYPQSHDIKAQPLAMYSGRETALKAYLTLGETPEQRDEEILRMEPVILDILETWDAVECEFGCLSKKYRNMTFVTKRVHPISLLSNCEIPYFVPQAILYPVVGAFRALITVDGNGRYGWKQPPLEVWQELKKRMATDVINELTARSQSLDSIAKNKVLWSHLNMVVDHFALQTM